MTQCDYDDAVDEATPEDHWFRPRTGWPNVAYANGRPDNLMPTDSPSDPNRVNDFFIPEAEVHRQYTSTVEVRVEYTRHTRYTRYTRYASCVLTHSLAHLTQFPLARSLTYAKAIGELKVELLDTDGLPEMDVMLFDRNDVYAVLCFEVSSTLGSRYWVVGTLSQVVVVGR